MSRDIFQFWSELPEDACQHPEDRDVIERIKPGFDPSCLPSAYRGPLRSAPVVLLFLSPGLDPRDLTHSASEKGRKYYARERSGKEKLPTKEEHPSAYEWLRKVLRQFDIKSDHDYELARSTVATLDIGPYKSKTFNDWPMLAALPSCRVTLDWAQSVLFPQAEAGKRIVVCMRSPKYWGLGGETKGSLFCPPCTRGAHMRHGDMRNRVTAAVRKAVLGSGQEQQLGTVS